jgi:two-component system chemotaxis response regulator CheB
MMHRSFDLVVVGGSAGAIEALPTILSGLPRSFAAPVVVVLHRAGDQAEALTRILAPRSALPVKAVRSGEDLLPATAHVAPAGCHVLVGRGPRLLLWDGPAVHGFKPAIDPLFDSAARIFGERLVAVILGRWGLDGSSGARAVKNAGGTVLAQDRATSRDVDVPASAIASMAVSHLLPVQRIAPALHSLVSSGSFEAW